MKNYTPDLNLLAWRVRQGDTAARTELCRQLEPGMFLMVRRTLQSGMFRPGMAQRILEETRRVAPFVSSLKDLPAYLMAQVARNLCNRLVDRLQSDPRIVHHLRETVVA
jgi:hypothetical protein